MSMGKTPGPYGREVIISDRPIQGTATAIAGFIGVCEKGDLTKVIECNSWSDFVLKCGARLVGYNTAYAVKGFFDNGGKKCYISRVTHYSGGVTTAVKASKVADGREDGTTDTMTVYAVNEGAWGNNISFDVINATEDLEALSYVRVYDASTGAYTDKDDEGTTEGLYKAFVWDGSSFTDKTTDAKAESPTAYDAFDDISGIGVDDALYIGSKYSTFGHVTISTANNSSCVAGVVTPEYWNGYGWQTITGIVLNDLSIGSAVSLGVAALENNDFSFAIPSTWEKTTVNSVDAYWIRLRVTTPYTTAVPQIKKIQINPPLAGTDKQFTPFPSTGMAIGDCLYLGSNNTMFEAVELAFQSVAAGGSPTNAIEYYSNGTWKALTVTESTSGVTNFTANGSLFWTAPIDWTKVQVNSRLGYWIRFRCTAIASGTEPVMYSALSPGTKFGMVIKYSGIEVETWDNLSMTSTNSRFVEAILEKSNYVRAVVATTALKDKRPLVLANQYLTSGDDGLTSLANSDYIGELTYLNGFYAFNAKKDVRALACPDQAGDEDIMNELLWYCEGRADCYAYIDPAAGLTAEQMRTWRKTTGNFVSSYGATYWPHGKVSDPIGAGDSPKKTVPLSGHIMGMTARMHKQYGVHQAAAGTEARLIGVYELERDVTEADTDLLNPEGVNCIVTDSTYGIYVLGSRSLVPESSIWRYQSKRLTAIYVMTSLIEGAKPLVWKPHNEDNMWKPLRIKVKTFLMNMWKSGALYDGGSLNPNDAFFHICDASINTQEVVDSGIVKNLVGICITTPGEFIVFDIGQWDGGRVVKELVSNGIYV